MLQDGFQTSSHVSHPSRCACQLTLCRIDNEYCKGSLSNPVPGTKFASLQYTYEGKGFPNPNNPKTVNIQQWIKGIGIHYPNPDLFSAFDRNYDSSIGGLNKATERMFNSQRLVPLFEFRDLTPIPTSAFETFMSEVDTSIQALHKKFAIQPASKD